MDCQLILEQLVLPAAAPMDAGVVLLSAQRFQSGLSMRQLAEMLHVRVATVWSWEAGVTRPPIALAADLALVLGVSPGKLLDAYRGSWGDLRDRQRKALELGGVG